MVRFQLQPLSKISPALPKQSPQWNLQEVSGRLIEISEPYPVAALSFAFKLLREAQITSHSVAWIGLQKSSFYPPDAMQNGIDLKNLPVFRLQDSLQMGQVATTLMRNGAFQLVVLDLMQDQAIPLAKLSQLNALARKHNSTVIFLTQKQTDAPSLSSLVSLKAHTTRKRLTENRFRCHIHIERDKRRGTSWSWNFDLKGVEGYY